MSLAGPAALRSIEEALRDIRREEDDVTHRLTRSAERMTKIRESEADLVRQLMAARLVPEAREALERPLAEAGERLGRAMRDHAARLGAAQAELESLDRSIEALIAERAAELDEIAKLQEALKAISAGIADSLANDEPFQASRQAAAEAARLAREGIAKSNQADLDREAKGRPFREDRLFSYLWQAGYGTPAYRANPLVRRLDGWVARLIGYDRAREIYVMADELPRRLRQFAEQQAERAQEAQAEVDAHFEAAINMAGGAPLNAALAQHRSVIAEIDGRILEGEDRRDELARMQRELAQGNDEELAAAFAALSAALRGEGLGHLVAEARRGGSDEGQALAAQIDGVRRRAEEEEGDAAELRERLRTLAARRRELEDIQYEFKRAHFDDPRSEFRDEALVGELLTAFLRGELEAGAYWDRWQRSQQWTSGHGSRPGPWADGGGPGPAAYAASGRKDRAAGFSRPRATSPIPRRPQSLGMSGRA